MANIKLDEVGQWTEIKLQILRDYSAAYSTILRRQSAIRHYAYIDGFAGAGSHISKTRFHSSTRTIISLTSTETGRIVYENSRMAGQM